MNFIINIFWNREEERLRSAYRLSLGIISMIFLSGLMSSISGIRMSDNPDTPLGHFLYAGSVRLFTTFLAVWLVGRFLDKRSFADFGFHFNKKWWQDFTFGMVLGAVAMSAIFVFQYSVGWITISGIFYVSQAGQSFILPLLVFLFLFICVGINEELASRGFLLTNFAEGLTFKKTGPKVGLILAWVITSGMFGLLHAGNPNATFIAVLNIVFAGILLGTAFVLTGRLAIPIGLHISWNFFQGTVFGFPVSGTNPGNVASVYSIEQGGPQFWTGGAFGPEAGMLGVIAMICGIVLILAWTRWREGKIQLFTSIALPPNIKHKEIYTVNNEMMKE